MSNGPRAHIHEVLPVYLALKAHMLDLLGRVLAH